MDDEIRNQLKRMMKRKIGDEDDGGYSVGGAYDMDMMGDYGEGVMIDSGGYGTRAGGKKAAKKNPWIEFLRSVPKGKYTKEELVEMYRCGKRGVKKGAKKKKGGIHVGGTQVGGFVKSDQDRLRNYVKKYIRNHGAQSFHAVLATL